MDIDGRPHGYTYKKAMMASYGSWMSTWILRAGKLNRVRRGKRGTG